MSASAAATTLPTYLLLGPEEGEKQRRIEQIRSTIGNIKALDEYSFYAFDTPVADVVALLRNRPLFSDHVLVLYRDAEHIKGKADGEIVANYLRQPSPYGTLIMVSSSYRLSGSWGSLVPKAGQIIFWEKRGKDMRALLAEGFRQRDIEFDPDALDLLLELIGNNSAEMAVELDRLCWFATSQGRITAELIDTYLYHSRTENAFSLFDRVVQRDFTGSLEILNTILLSGRGAEIGLLSTLLWQFRQLLALSRLTQMNDGDRATAFRSLRIVGQRRQTSYNIGLGNYPIRSLERIVALGAEYEAALRQFGGPLQRGLLQQFLYYVVIKQDVGPHISATWIA